MKDVFENEIPSCGKKIDEYITDGIKSSQLFGLMAYQSFS